MARGTRAIQALEQSGIVFHVHEYTISRSELSYGEAVAEAVGVNPSRLFKTLMATVDGSLVVAIVPVSGQLALKKLARAVGGKHAAMAEAADAQRITGYVVGGISPFGQKRPSPTYVDSSVADHDTVFVSAGRRGLQVELAPQDLIEVASATMVDLATAPVDGSRPG
ncbi:MAG: Cys-tRNA(Pro) deacylase [Proteobacteria bacterium]|nr:Cys-tRNA(Pro) deacylase [Pseudomonadota bacterium]